MIDLGWGDDIGIGEGCAVTKSQDPAPDNSGSEMGSRRVAKEGVPYITTEPTVGLQSDGRTNPITEMSERENT